MSKGKYATRAALRREDGSVRSEIETYQHHVQRLTNENQLLRGRLDDEGAAHKAEVRKLRAMLNEGLSPELLALREQLERQRDKAARAKAAQGETREKWGILTTFTCGLLHEVTGCTGLEAMEAMLKALGWSPDWMIVDQSAGADPHSIKEGQPERARTLQRVRGFRSSAKVIANLNALCARAMRPPLGNRPRDAKRERWRDAR